MSREESFVDRSSSRSPTDTGRGLPVMVQFQL